MRNATPLLLALFTSHARAQVVCDTLPIAYYPVSITFTTADLSFGDSVLVVEMTNSSTTSMAYPQIKLVPLTPLPSGMVMNTGWSVFASSWNPGQMMPASVFFDVSQPIPEDFTVTFQVWATNLTPLLTDDSCVFDLPFTINLNPSGTGIGGGAERPSIEVWPIPANDQLGVRLPGYSFPARLMIIDAMGVEISSFSVAAGSREVALPIDRIAPGAYQVILWSPGRMIQGLRIAVVR